MALTHMWIIDLEKVKVERNMVDILVSLSGTCVGWECLDAVVGWWHQSEEHKNMNTFIRIHLLQIIFCY